MKELFYVALLGLLVTACGKKDDEVINDDPNGWRQKLKGDWIQYRHVMYTKHLNGNNEVYKVDTAITPARAYWKFTETQIFRGDLNGTLEDIDMDSGGTYTIKGDSIRHSSAFEYLECVGDSVKMEYRIQMYDHSYEEYVKVIHRINK